MKLLTVAAAIAAFTTLTVAPAFAANDAIVAKLAQPVAQPTKFIAGGSMFVCEGDSCVAAAPGSQTFSVGSCKIIAGKVGMVTSFGGYKALDDAKLGDCNAVAVAKAAGGPQLAKQ